jgi:hypothetical protein
VLGNTSYHYSPATSGFELNGVQRSNFEAAMVSYPDNNGNYQQPD